ncbi:uncharacterized protein Dyak_GE27665, isoform B [Drosophila yakuba]|nr:uncharacterized protein Dyak_GE27665, isoform B [Drosophila yakuba]
MCFALAPLKFCSASQSGVPIAVHSVLSSPRERSCPISGLRSTIHDPRSPIFGSRSIRYPIFAGIELCSVRATPKSRRVVGCVRVRESEQKKAKKVPIRKGSVTSSASPSPKRLDLARGSVVIDVCMSYRR